MYDYTFSMFVWQMLATIAVSMYHSMTSTIQVMPLSLVLVYLTVKLVK